MNIGNITASDLAAKCDVSVSTLSRYTNGSRTPDPESDTLDKLADGIFSLGKDHFLEAGMTRGDVFAELAAALESELKPFDFDALSQNMRTILTELGISTSSISSELFISNSTMSRILAGNYKPRDPDSIVDNMCQFLKTSYGRDDDVEILCSMLERETGISRDSYDDPLHMIGEWLRGHYEDTKNATSLELLSSISQFDLSEYLSAMNISDVHIPTTRFKIPTTKAFTGQKGLEDGIISFMKATATSSSTNDVFLYSDLPLEHLTENPETLKQWMMGLGAILLQGKPVTVIHNTDRPTKEMMLGFEAWIPLYMTGNIQSYYTEGTVDNLFHHILLVSGSAVLSGYTIKGSEEQSSFTFSKSMTKIKEGRLLATQLLNSCKPLVAVYDLSRKEEYVEFLKEDAKAPGPRISYPGTLPVATISDRVLESILDRNSITGETREQITDYVRSERERYETVLSHSSIVESVEKFSQKDLVKNDISLSLTRHIPAVPLYYTPEEYAEHLASTESFADSHEGYTIELHDSSAFKNISITVQENGSAILSRNRGEELHFVIQQPRMVRSLYNLKVPIWDK